MNNLLFVWAYPYQSIIPIPCGQLELLGGRQCLFQYDSRWLSDSRSFALSPDLPLVKGIFEPPNNTKIHPIFEDSSPDRWGQQIIDQIFRPARRSPIDYLILAGENRVGALGFSLSKDDYLVSEQQSFFSIDLPSLLDAAEALKKQMPINDRLRQLLKAGASMGGARPKVILMEDSHQWIAKFPVDDDFVDVAAVEHASLCLAKACGIEVPKSKLIKVGNKNIFMIERFDRTINGERYHFASARTLLISNGILENEMGYSDIADCIRLGSSQPKNDCHELFRRMAFNVLMENTDDHEKNHAFLMIDKQWRLSPAYDIQPQLLGLKFQQLRVGTLGADSTLDNIMSEFGRFMLTKKEAISEINQMLSVLKDWPRFFEEQGVTVNDIDKCQSFVRVNTAINNQLLIENPTKKIRSTNPAF